MADDRQETKQSRVVVETPTARREVTSTEREYTPDRGGTSTATIAVVVVLAIGVAVLLVLLVMNRQSSENANLLAAQQAAQQPTQQQPVIIQQPAPQQQPIIVQQPAAPAAQPPVIVNPPAATGPPAEGVLDDGTIQAGIDMRIHNNADLSASGITATVTNGKVILMGSVRSEQLKSQAEKLVRSVKGVKGVDNQITVVAG